MDTYLLVIDISVVEGEWKKAATESIYIGVDGYVQKKRKRNVSKIVSYLQKARNNDAIAAQMNLVSERNPIINPVDTEVVMVISIWYGRQRREVLYSTSWRGVAWVDAVCDNTITHIEPGGRKSILIFYFQSDINIVTKTIDWLHSESLLVRVVYLKQAYEYTEQDDFHIYAYFF